MTDEDFNLMITKRNFLDRIKELEAPEGFGWELINEKHSSHIVEWRNDPEILPLMESNNKITLEDQAEFLENHETLDRVDLVLVSKVPVGVFSIKNMESTPEYGALIGNKVNRGKGLGFKAKMLIFNYWFSVLGKKEIFVKNAKSNLKVLRSNQSLGFQKFEEQEDFVMLRLGKDDFLTNSLKSTEP